MIEYSQRIVLPFLPTLIVHRNVLCEYFENIRHRLTSIQYYVTYSLYAISYSSPRITVKQ